MTEFEIMQIQPEDKDYFGAVAHMFTELTNFHAKAVPEVFEYPGPIKTPEFVQGIVKNNDHAIFTAHKNGNIVAVAQVSIVRVSDKPGWCSRKFGYLDRLFVKPDFRRLGIATALVRAREDWLKLMGVNTVELNIWAFNAETRALYLHLGYDIKNLNLWRKL